MQKKFREIRKDETIESYDTRRFYRNKYYGVFINNFKLPQLSEQQQHFFLKEMWHNGRINAFVLPESRTPEYIERVDDAENTQELILTPFAPVLYNIYDFPIEITPINRRGAKFIPSTNMIVNKDCVIGYAHKTHCSVEAMVNYYIDKIVDVENTIRTTLFNLKLPRLIAVQPEDELRIKRIVEAIESGVNKLYLSVEDVSKISAVLNGDSSSADTLNKLFNYKQALENELQTWLGVDNKGTEKRERQIVDEVNANNGIINESHSSFLESMQEFCKNVSEVLGYTLTIESNREVVDSIHEEDKKEEEIDENIQ